MSPVHWLREVPAEIRAHDTLVGANYEDIFYGLAIDAVDMSPEAWARSFYGAPARLRLVLRLAHFTQRRVLGMRLNRDSPHHFLGWELAARGDHWFRLEAISWMGEGHLIFHRDRQRVSVATILRYDRRIGKVIWVPVSRLHALVGLLLLRYALEDPSLRLSRRRRPA